MTLASTRWYYVPNGIEPDAQEVAVAQPDTADRAARCWRAEGRRGGCLCWCSGPPNNVESRWCGPWRRSGCGTKDRSQ